MSRFGRASAAARGYDGRWAKARATFLAEHPLCVLCEALGHTTAATVVDHKKPHRGDQALFWDTNNWQPLCKECHDRHKQRLEKSGYLAGCSADGMPLDPDHPWNRSRSS